MYMINTRGDCELRNLNLVNCNIENTISIVSKYSVAIESANSSFNLNYCGIGPIIEQQLLELENHFQDPIEINSSAQIRINNSCSCEKIIINGPENSKIYFIGDISKIKIIEIKSPCYIYSNFTQDFSTMNFPILSIQLSSYSTENKIYINGNFLQSNLILHSYCNIYISGTIGLLSVDLMLPQIPILLSLNTEIKSINLYSYVNITGEEQIINKLKDPMQTPGVGHDKINVDMLSFKASTVNGEATLTIKIPDSGSYTVSAYLSLDNSNKLIASKNITII